MDLFLNDRDLRHERVNNTLACLRVNIEYRNRLSLNVIMLCCK